MPQKIVYLAAMFTMAYWLGHGVGCSSNRIENQNYKILEEDQPMFETKLNPSDPGAAAPADEDTAASLAGIDRSHWGRVAVGPDKGQIRHSPHYFDDCPIYQLRSTSRNPLDDVDQAGWDKADSLAVVAQPFKFAFDMVWFPVRLAMDPPTQWQIRLP